MFALILPLLLPRLLVLVLLLLVTIGALRCVAWAMIMMSSNSSAGGPFPLLDVPGMNFEHSMSCRQRGERNSVRKACWPYISRWNRSVEGNTEGKRKFVR
jgi:hypothetical protein